MSEASIFARERLFAVHERQVRNADRREASLSVGDEVLLSTERPPLQTIARPPARTASGAPPHARALSHLAALSAQLLDESDVSLSLCALRRSYLDTLAHATFDALAERATRPEGSAGPMRGTTTDREGSGTAPSV
jgi:hypothetical protein